MRSQRWAWTHTYAVPLFVASLVAVLVAGAALVTVVLVNGTAQEPPPVAGETGRGTTGPDRGPDTPDTPGTPAGPDGDGGGDRDDCLAGRWEVVAHTEGLMDLGTMEMVSAGPAIEYRADGSGTADYRDGVEFRAESGLGETTLTVTGQVDYRYEVSGDTLRYYDVDSAARYEVNAAGLTDGMFEGEFTYDEEPFNYHCAGDVLTFDDPGQDYSAELHRVGGGGEL